MNTPETSELRDIAAAIYKLGVVAAELGLTGQESAEELRSAVRALKARATPPVPDEEWARWTAAMQRMIREVPRAVLGEIAVHTPALSQPHKVIEWQTARAALTRLAMEHGYWPQAETKDSTS